MADEQKCGKKAFVTLAVVCGLLLFVLGATMNQATHTVPVQYAQLAITGVRAVETQEGCWIAVRMQNCSSVAGIMRADDFTVLDERGSRLELLSETAEPDTPFRSGWDCSLPAGRSGEMEFLVTPPKGEQITLTWYEGEEEHQLVVPVE